MVQELFKCEQFSSKTLKLKEKKERRSRGEGQKEERKRNRRHKCNKHTNICTALLFDLAIQT